MEAGPQVSIIIKQDNTQKALRDIDDGIAKALDACGALVEGYAKQVCPVDTGRLRNSITHRLKGDDTVLVGSNVEYAQAVELGSSRSKAQPYLRPAVEDHTEEIRKLFTSIVK